MCFEAITAGVFFHWAFGQSRGPDNLLSRHRRTAGTDPQGLTPVREVTRRG